MSLNLPEIYLARHGETIWTISGQHTGLTDLPLTARGERNACQLGRRLQGLTFAEVFASPLVRASQTCKFAGFASVATLEDKIVEWNYGDYEGKTSAEIGAQRPGWDSFRDGCPGGETVRDVSARADVVIARARCRLD